MSETEFEPATTWVTPEREQYWYRFPNGFGASVFRTKVRYGCGQTDVCRSKQDEYWSAWELAVVRWDDKGGYKVVKDTPITAEVMAAIGDWVLPGLDDDEVRELLKQIRDL